MKKIVITILSLVMIAVCTAAVFLVIHFGKMSAETVIMPKKKLTVQIHRNEWVSERDQSYYYNEKGEKSRGLTVIGDKTYYFDNKLNYMKKGWATVDGSRHYFGEDGVMATGTVSADGNTYYFDEKYYFDNKLNYMKKGWATVDGSRHYFGEDGVMATGTVSADGNTYYFDENGVMAVGWQERDGQTYYYDENGVQAFGFRQIDGKDCWFDEMTGAYKQTNIDTSKPMVAITYDDGPSSVTGKILDILEKNGAKATFFQIGNQVESYPEVEKRINSLGCELANHTWEHKWLSSLDVDGINYQLDHTSDTVESITGRRPKLMRPPGGFYNETVQAEADMPMIYWSVDNYQLDHTSDTVESITGRRPKLMRPPGGFYNETVQAEADMPMIYWSVDTEDWKTRDAKKTISAVLDHVKDGDIVLMHDLYEQTAEASETIIPELIKRGYQLVTVSELAQARGVSMENGKVYYSFYK